MTTTTTATMAADDKFHLDRLISSIRQRIAFGLSYDEIEYDLLIEGEHDPGDVYLCYVAARLMASDTCRT